MGIFIYIYAKLMGSEFSLALMFCCVGDVQDLKWRKLLNIFYLSRHLILIATHSDTWYMV